MNIKKVVNFIFELGQLKRVRHNGFKLCGVKDPATVAEHGFRAAQIAYLLAVMEGYDNPEEAACILLVHDNSETRVGDADKMNAKYYENKAQAEAAAFADQLELLGEDIKAKWQKYYEAIEGRATPAGVIAKDADWLEVAFQAKEYADLGYRSAKDIIHNVEKAVETGSAKKLIAEMKDTEFTDWWQGLKRMTYEKLDNNGS